MHLPEHITTVPSARRQYAPANTRQPMPPSLELKESDNHLEDPTPMAVTPRPAADTLPISLRNREKHTADQGVNR